jgi:hypothetical protein
LGMMAISRWPIVASFADRTEKTMFRLLLWSGWETSHLCQTIDQVTADACHVGLASVCMGNTVLGNLKHVQVII